MAEQPSMQYMLGKGNTVALTAQHTGFEVCNEVFNIDRLTSNALSIKCLKFVLYLKWWEQFT